LLGELYATHGIQSSCAPVEVSGTADWQVSIHGHNGLADQLGNVTDWIVTGMSIPAGPVVLVYSAAAFASTFTVA